MLFLSMRALVLAFVWATLCTSVDSNARHPINMRRLQSSVNAATLQLAGSTGEDFWIPDEPPEEELWSIVEVSGRRACTITHGGWCISDGDGFYSDDESCEVRAEADVHVTAIVFGTEAGYDFLELCDSEACEEWESYSGASSYPVGVFLPQGGTVVWASDYSESDYEGFEV
jgi:hypothetical protein